jgi:hypothetical protein
MNAEEYVNQRLDPQIKWYDKKSKQNKISYYVLRIVEIVCAISIPLIMGYVSDSTPSLKTVAALLGAIVGMISGFLGLFQAQENWISYRTTCETLRHEKYLYLTKSKPYDNKEHFALLVERVELIVSKENTGWSQMLKTTKKKN